MRERKRRAWIGYLLAVISTAAVAAFGVALSRAFGEFLSFLLFVVPVIAAGWYGGLRPGLFATVLALLVNLALFVPPEDTLLVDHPRDAFASALFLITGVTLSAVFESLHLARRRAQRQATLLDQAGDATITWRLDGAILDWNRGAERLYGYSRAEAIGRRATELLATQSGAPLDEIRAQIELEARWEGPLTHTTKRGDRVVVDAHMVQVNAPDGEPLVLQVDRDLTPRIRAEEALLRSSEFHAAIADLSADFAFDLRVEPDGTIETEAVTDGFVKVLGYTLEEKRAIGGWAALVHPDDRAQIQQLLVRVSAGETVEGELRHLAKDRRTVWLHFRARPVRGRDGSLHVYGAAQDVTIRRKAESALQATQAQLQLVTDRMSVPVTRCSRDLTYLWASKTYAEWVGITPEKIIGKPIVDVIGPAAFESIRPYVERALAGERVHYELELDLSQRGRRWIEASYTPTFDSSGLPDGWVAVVIDIDERKRTEKTLADAHKRKDEFLAILAHELRNPLAPIRNAVQILRLPGVAENDLEEARAIIERQIRQMVLLIDELLDVSRITRGVVQLKKQTVDLSQVLRAAIETAAPLIEAGGHELVVTLPDEPIVLEADPTRLAQVVSNLLNNAAKYTEPGGRIWLGAERRGREAVVAVHDTGIGIAPDHLAHIFEMFSQAAPALERSQGGLGIGLALVRGLVELHGGRVEANSRGLGKGSEFTVHLPITKNAPTAVEPGPDADGSPLPARRRVLVVDDNRDSAASLDMLLRCMGHDTCAAYDGLEAVQAVVDFGPDLVLLDIGLPKLNGYEAARRIREHPSGRDTLLVAVTGWGQEEDRRRAMEAGFDRHMTKPVNPEALTELLAGLRSRRLA